MVVRGVGGASLEKWEDGSEVGERPFPQKVTEGPSTAQIALQGPITGLKLSHNSNFALISGSAYYIKVCGPVETLQL